MLTETHLEKYARVLFWGMQKARVTPFSPGDVVLVRTDIAALPLAEKVQALLLEKRLYPVAILARVRRPDNYFTVTNMRRRSSPDCLWRRE